MMSPKTVAALVLQMKPPLEIQNDYSRIRWMLEQAATIATRVTMDEIMTCVKKNEKAVY